MKIYSFPLLAAVLLMLSGCCASPHWRNCSKARWNDSQRMRAIAEREPVQSEWKDKV